MNAVEIEQAISQLAERPFDAGPLACSWMHPLGYASEAIAGSETSCSSRDRMNLAVIRRGNNILSVRYGELPNCWRRGPSSDKRESTPLADHLFYRLKPHLFEPSCTPQTTAFTNPNGSFEGATTPVPTKIRIRCAACWCVR